MDAVHALQLNQAKGLIETTRDDLKSQQLTSFKDEDFGKRTEIIERLDALLDDLAEIVSAAGEIAVEPIPLNPNTAWEVASLMVNAHRGGHDAT
jgi:hypothetical protein